MKTGLKLLLVASVVLSMAAMPATAATTAEPANECQSIDFGVSPQCDTGDDDGGGGGGGGGCLCPVDIIAMFDAL